MNVIRCAGAALAVDQAGEGAAVVLVHGAWTDRSTWDPVFSELALRFRAIRYDRRGYGESSAPGAPVATHAEDVVALARALGLERVTLVGNSIGGVIAMLAALKAPALVDWVVAHEPPLLEVLDLVPERRPLTAKIRLAVQATLEAVQSGDHRLAAQRYVEAVASYPGAWQYLPEHLQNEFERYAAAFYADTGGAGEDHVTPEELRQLEPKLAISRGDRSSPYLRMIADQLAIMLPAAQRRVFEKAGHLAHQSCPAEFVEFLGCAMAARGIATPSR